ncbi:MAG: hypothetical protein QOF60_1660 [Actinomycetota bacterium]|jgi:hypothetical protein|nr:hypothetical protein [Actinomycetota bacterium]
MTGAGGVELTGVWLDDRRRCRWALTGVDLSLDPGTLVVIEADTEDEEIAAEAVFDLLTYRRLPVAGTVVGASRDAVEIGSPCGEGERRLCLPGGLEIVVRASSATRLAASRTVRLPNSPFVNAQAGMPA